MNLLMGWTMISHDTSEIAPEDFEKVPSLILFIQNMVSESFEWYKHLSQKELCKNVVFDMLFFSLSPNYALTIEERPMCQIDRNWLTVHDKFLFGWQNIKLFN